MLFEVVVDVTCRRSCVESDQVVGVLMNVNVKYVDGQIEIGSDKELYSQIARAQAP